MLNFIVNRIPTFSLVKIINYTATLVWYDLQIVNLAQQTRHVLFLNHRPDQLDDFKIGRYFRKLLIYLTEYNLL